MYYTVGTLSSLTAFEAAQAAISTLFLESNDAFKHPVVSSLALCLKTDGS